MLKLIFIFVMISFVTQEVLGQIPITDYDEVYSCDKIPSELRVLLISPQQYYLYEGALQEPKGRLIPEGKLKTLNRLLTVSGYMNGLEETTEKRCITIIETQRLFTSLNIIDCLEEIRTRCFNPILVAIYPDSRTETLLQPAEREVLIGQLQLINQVYNEDVWERFAFLYMMEDDNERGQDSKFNKFSDWVNNVMREVDNNKEIKLSSFLLNKEFQNFVFASSGRSGGEVDETCKCFHLKFPNFFQNEFSGQISVPWFGLPSEILVNPQALRPSANLSCFIHASSLQKNDVALSKGAQFIQTSNITIVEHHNDIKEVIFFLENPEDGTYVCRHKEATSENYVKIVYTQNTQSWSQWSQWSKCDNIDESSTRVRTLEKISLLSDIIESGSISESSTSELLALLPTFPVVQMDKRPCLCSDLKVLPHPRILLLGPTGVGKSTLGNQLFGGRKRFAVGHQLSSKTEYISILASNYLGTDKCFTLIDTPGAKDTLGRDYKQSLDMQRLLKKDIGSFDAILLLFKGTDTRFDSSTLDLLLWYEAIFGKEMWHHVIVQTTFWGHSKKESHQRLYRRQMTEEKLKKELLLQLKRSSLNIPSNFALELLFIDPVLQIFNDPCDPIFISPEEIEKAKFVHYTKRLVNIISTFNSSFDCRERCQAPDAFYSGAPWLSQPVSGSIYARSGEAFNLEWQIWAGVSKNSSASYNITMDGNIIFQKKINVTEKRDRDDISFEVKESEILKKITVIQMKINVSKTFLDESYEAEFKVDNGQEGETNGAKVFLKKDAYFDNWSIWSHCSISCMSEETRALGDKKRFRHCNPEINQGVSCQQLYERDDPKNDTFFFSDLSQVEMKKCAGESEVAMFCPIQAAWTDWGPWSRCPGTCGVWTQSRERFCKDGRYGGEQCASPIEREIKDCELSPCPVDCQWGVWETWGSCSLTCGMGSQTRKREIETPSSGGGRNCSGEFYESKICTNFKCVNCQWAEWEEWGDCSTHCNGGKVTRKRGKAVQPSGGGSECNGLNNEVRDCFLKVCGYDKILVAGGGSATVEIIDIETKTTNCNDLSPLPWAAYSPVGALGFQDKPLICGGLYQTPRKECFSYDNGTWTPYFSLNSPRFEAAISLSPFLHESHKIFLSGGHSDKHLDTNEVLTEEGWRTVLPSMPVKTCKQCMVLKNSTTVIITGGLSSPSTYLFNTELGGWYKGPPLMIARLHHSCGKIKRKAGSRQKSIIVAGGYNHGRLSSVEILDEGSNEWRSGPSLPFGIIDAVMVEDSKGGVVLVGGNDGTKDLNTLYRLANAGGDAKWTKMSQRLKQGRSGHTAFIARDDVTTCN